MSVQQTLLALAERCEKANEPDRQLDLTIGQAVGSVDSRVRWNDAFGFGYPGKSVDVPRYTASIDAAITLVPKGWEWGCGYKDATGEPWAWVGKPRAGSADWEPMVPRNAATAALALTGAALQARSITCAAAEKEPTS